MTEGKVVSVPKEIAEELGAFIETAISFDDAKPQKKTQEQEELQQAAKTISQKMEKSYRY